MKSTLYYSLSLLTFATKRIIMSSVLIEDILRMTPLKTQAIHTALTGDWKAAVSINQELLKENPDDVETLNRLAFAFTILGKNKHAKDTYLRVLELDTKNPIALKNLRRLSNGKTKTNKLSRQLRKKQDSEAQPLEIAYAASYSFEYSTNMFLEETGKTKVIELINVAEPKIIAQLRTGEFLTLQIKRLKIFVLDRKKQYIGMLPDNIARRLIKFLKGGNSYEAYVKSAENHKVSIFARETKRATRFKNQPSFIAIEKTLLLFGKSPTSSNGKTKKQDDDNYLSEDEAS